jgi:hypothetical protein
MTRCENCGMLVRRTISIEELGLPLLVQGVKINSSDGR